MKAKRSVYILLAAVVLIWGLIAQRLWSSVGPSPLRTPRLSNTKLVGEAGAADQHLPLLLLSYADPFQASRPLEAKLPSEQLAAPRLPPRRYATSSLSLLSPPAATPPPALVVWPEIKYLGSIANQRAGTKVALLSIDNVEVMLKLGDSAKGVRIVKVYADSIQVTFSGHKKSFLKSG